MRAIIAFAKRPLTSESLDMSLASISCYAAGLAMFSLCMLQLPRFELSETELFFGVLIIVAASFQLILAGGIFEGHCYMKKLKESQPHQSQ